MRILVTNFSLTIKNNEWTVLGYHTHRLTQQQANSTVQLQLTSMTCQGRRRERRRRLDGRWRAAPRCARQDEPRAAGRRQTAAERTHRTAPWKWPQPQSARDSPTTSCKRWSHFVEYIFQCSTKTYTCIAIPFSGENFSTWYIWSNFFCFIDRLTYYMLIIWYNFDK